MVYELKSNTVLFEIDRTEIVDVSIGDKLKVCCLADASYTWTDQDAQFIENNPDARVFLKFRKNTDSTFEGVGVSVFPQEVY